jgi:ribosomal-protein-serine acetyltransferase
VLLPGGEPAGELATERLVLRTPRRGDLADLDLAIHETLDELVRWLPWAQPGHSRADTRRYLRSARIARARRRAIELAIQSRHSGELLGMISLHRIDWLRRSAGMGYWIRRTSWGKGLATEAARAALDLGFNGCGLHRIEVHIAVENRASQRVAEKLGLVREGVARGVEFVNGRYLDHIQYALLRSDVTSPQA